MKIIPIFQVDAFSHGPFTGNPAAVCVSDSWTDSLLMQKIAMENNLAETAFISPFEGQWRIRWFTPVTEVDLCGHATLASSYVVLNILQPERDEVTFSSMKMGWLTVRRRDGLLELDFPSDTVTPCGLPAAVSESLGAEPAESYTGREDYLLVYRSEDEIAALRPDFRKLGMSERRGIIVTAPGRQCDFVSRFFAPQVGIDEDPVTGSAHTTLTPFWAGRLGKERLSARQLSARGGVLECTFKGDRTLIAGKALLYLKGEIYV